MYLLVDKCEYITALKLGSPPSLLLYLIGGGGGVSFVHLVFLCPSCQLFFWSLGTSPKAIWCPSLSIFLYFSALVFDLLLWEMSLVKFIFNPSSGLATRPKEPSILFSCLQTFVPLHLSWLRAMSWAYLSCLSYSSLQDNLLLLSGAIFPPSLSLCPIFASTGLQGVLLQKEGAGEHKELEKGGEAVGDESPHCSSLFFV